MKKEKTVFDRDGNLKEVLSVMLLYAIAYFLPELSAQLDPNKSPILLNKELLAIKKGRFRDKIECDVLVKCFLLDSEGNASEKIIVLHWEFEGNPLENFGIRVFRYYVRIFDVVQSPDITIQVIYTGPPSKYQINQYKNDTFGTSVNMQFNACIVCNLEPEKLEQHPNPFALVLLAIHYTIQTSGFDKAEQRFRFKEKLFELGFARNFSEEILVALYKFVTNFMDLPVILERKFETVIEEKYFKEMTRPATQAELGMATAIYKGIYGINPQMELAKLKKEATSAKKEATSAKKEATSAKKEATSAKKKYDELQTYFTKAIFTLHEAGFSEEQISEKLELGTEFVKNTLKISKNN